MNEPFIPWWLVLLLAVWAAALTVWQCPDLLTGRANGSFVVHREIRLWAGSLSVVYLVLIFLALGIGFQRNQPPQASSPFDSFANFGFGICIVASLTSSVWILGQITPQFKRICYLTLTVSNAVACALMQCPEIAIGLLIVALPWSTRHGFMSLWHDAFTIGRNFSRSWSDSPVRRDHGGRYGLLFTLSLVLSSLLFGTLVYSLRIETARVIPSPRYTALPSRSQLSQFSSSVDVPATTSLRDLALGDRSDILVLVSVIAFLSLAAFSSTERTLPTLTPDSRNRQPNVAGEDAP